MAQLLQLVSLPSLFVVHQGRFPLETVHTRCPLDWFWSNARPIHRRIGFDNLSLNQQQRHSYSGATPDVGGSTATPNLTPSFSPAATYTPDPAFDTTPSTMAGAMPGAVGRVFSIDM